MPKQFGRRVKSTALVIRDSPQCPRNTPRKDPVIPEELFITLQAGQNGLGSSFLVEPRHCAGPSESAFLFGGVSVGAGILALEAACCRELIWTTAQFHGAARPGETVELVVEKLREGKTITQAELIAATPRGPVCRLMAALGSGSSWPDKTWRPAPDAKLPDALEPTTDWGFQSALHSGVDFRLVEGSIGLGQGGDPAPDGRLIFWIRPRGTCRIDKAFLAVIADFVPAGIKGALGVHTSARSLDNTFRSCSDVDTDWVLGEVIMEGMNDGFIHGSIALFDQDKKLLALGNQTLALV